MASPVVESVATTNKSSNATEITVTKPSGTAEGDLLFASICVDSQTPTIDTPSGWTALHKQQAVAISTAIFYKLAGGSEPSDYTFTWPSTNADSTAAIARISGAHQTTPIDVSDEGTGGSSTMVAPAVTTTVDDTLIVRVVLADQGATSIDPWTPPTDHTEEWDFANPTLFDGQGQTMAHIDQASAGDSGTGSFTANASDGYHGYTVAIAPAAGGGGGDVLSERRYPRGVRRGILRGAA